MRPSVSNAQISGLGRRAVVWRPTMHNNITTQSWDTLTLSTLKKTGADEYHGPCPVTGEGKDRFWVKPDDRRIGCRGCGHDGNGGLDPTQFKEHLEALGATFGEHDVLLTYDWTNYLAGETDPPDPSATVARGLAFGGTMGFIRGPKASGKTTILAAAAARVSRGQPWAGQDTEAGTVLVVCNDDPRSWTLALRDFGADTERLLMARARVVSRPGKLAALLAEHRPVWSTRSRPTRTGAQPRARGPAAPLALVLRGNTDSVVTWLHPLKEKALRQTRYGSERATWTDVKDRPGVVGNPVSTRRGSGGLKKSGAAGYEMGTRMMGRGFGRSADWNMEEIRE